jgi:capsular polysaccharide biosynthesis protein
MSGQALDLTRVMQILRRHRILITVCAVLGLLAGAGYSAYKPPMFTTQELVFVPFTPGQPQNSTYIATQVVIARSEYVLVNALPHTGATMSLATLRDRVQITSITANVISFTAEGRTAGQAVATVNAVVGSYRAYLQSPLSPYRVRARTLGRASPATGTKLTTRMAETGAIGLLPGLLLGFIIALAVGRRDRRLRERDQIADSIGIPVLASISTERPLDAAGWARLLDRYEPGQIDAWHMRKALSQLGLLGLNPASAPEAGGASDSTGSSLAVLSLSTDRAALSLGPQLAAFTASLGIRTALVMGPQQSEEVTATLHAACASAPPLRSGFLLVSVTGQVTGLPTEAELTVTIGVVDADNPRVAATARAATTVLGVSAGAATAVQLARVATSAAVDGRDISGILVADPDPADQTTGRVPDVVRLGERRIPTRTALPMTENRR